MDGPGPAARISRGGTAPSTPRAGLAASTRPISRICAKNCSWIKGEAPIRGHDAPQLAVSPFACEKFAHNRRQAAASANSAVPARFNRRIHVRIKALFSLAALGFASLAFAQAQNVVVEERKTETVTVVVKETPKPPAFVFELHGFISTTGYFQDAQFAAAGGGQSALFLTGTSGVAPNTPAARPGRRTSRSSASTSARPGSTSRSAARRSWAARFRRPSSSSTSSARASSPAPGAFGDVSILPRIRVAYVELNWDTGKHIIQIGQQNMLTIGTIPQSLSHIAFPATYTAGTVGWRQPGFWGWHTFGDDLKFELAWSVQRSGWANDPVRPGRGVERRRQLRPSRLRGPRQASCSARCSTSGSPATGRPSTATARTTSPRRTATTTWRRSSARSASSGNLGPVAYSGSAWYGKNAGPLLGNILQFTPRHLRRATSSATASGARSA